MSISNEIQKLQTNLTNSYEACSDKGATMPASQNFDNLADCIDSIPTGSTLKRTFVLEEEIGKVVPTIYSVTNNYVRVGSLTDNIGVLSEFSTSKYAYASSTIPSLGSNPWELECEIKTGTDFSSDQETLELSTKGASPFYFIKNGGGLRMFLSSDGINWDINNTGYTYLTLVSNTTYRLRCVFDGTKYEVQKYENNAWTTLETANSSTPINWDGNLWIGINMRPGSPANYWRGSINMNYCRLTSNGNTIWEGITKII